MSNDIWIKMSNEWFIKGFNSDMNENIDKNLSLNDEKYNKIIDNLGEIDWTKDDGLDF